MIKTRSWRRRWNCLSEHIDIFCHSEFISESILDFKKDNTMQDSRKISEINKIKRKSKKDS